MTIKVLTICDRPPLDCSKADLTGFPHFVLNCWSWPNNNVTRLHVVLCKTRFSQDIFGFTKAMLSPSPETSTTTHIKHPLKNFHWDFVCYHIHLSDIAAAARLVHTFFMSEFQNLIKDKRISTKMKKSNVLFPLKLTSMNRKMWYSDINNKMLLCFK